MFITKTICIDDWYIQSFLHLYLACRNITTDNFPPSFPASIMPEDSILHSWTPLITSHEVLEDIQFEDLL
jgi:hypothetical protein